MLTIFIMNLYYDCFKIHRKHYILNAKDKKKLLDGLIILNYVLNLRLIPVQKD